MNGVPLAFLDILNPGMLLILGVIAVLLFGERLPEVGRTFGQKFIQFKKSIQSVQDELRSAAYSATSAISSGLPSDLTGGGSSYSGDSTSSSSTVYDEEDRDVVTAPKFEPPKSELPIDKANL